MRQALDRMLTVHDPRPCTGSADEILLGFARALRAAGVPVTQDRAQGFLAAAAVLGARRPAGDVRRRPGHAVRRARRPARYDQVFEAYFNGRDGLPRPRGPSQPSVAGVRRPARRPTRTAAPASDDRRGCVRAMASEAEVLRHRDVAGADRRRRSSGWPRMFATLRPRAAGAAYRPAPARGTAATSTPPARCAPRLRRMGEPGRDRLAAPRRPPAPGGAAGRRVRLDERVRRRAAAARAPVHPGGRAASRRRGRDVHASAPG